jgi:plasmid stabilization system protein ParE
LKVRFSTRATVQITAALDYVAARSPQGAARIRNRLTEITALLESHPFTGRKTNCPRIRRLVTTPYPYLIDYRIAEDEIVIMRFCNAARR